MFKTHYLFLRLLVYIVLAFLIIQIYNLWPTLYIKQEVKSYDPQVFLENSLVAPEKLVIPKIDVSTIVQNVGLNQNGEMDVPKALSEVGWYKDGPLPGEKGNAVIAGHEVDQYGLGVVFKNLYLLAQGDSIFIQTKTGKELEFVVSDKKIYKYDEAPVKEIFGQTESINLNLITCAGEFLKDKKTKNQRLVIYTKFKN